MTHEVIPQQHGKADHAAPVDRSHIVKQIRKALVAACGAAAMVVSTGVLDDSAVVWVNALLGLATAAGVWAAPNAPTEHDHTQRA